MLRQRLNRMGETAGDSLGSRTYVRKTFSAATKEHENIKAKEK